MEALNLLQIRVILQVALSKEQEPNSYVYHSKHFLHIEIIDNLYVYIYVNICQMSDSFINVIKNIIGSFQI